MAALDNADVIQQLAELVSDNAGKQYDDYSKTFIALDGKAQAAGTSGGVLLGVIVALANAGTLASLLKVSDWFLLILLPPVLVAVFAMLKALEAAWIEEVHIPFDFDQQAKEFKDLDTLRNETFTQDDIIDFHRRRHLQWESSLRSIKDVVNRKGPLVRQAQGAVVWSAILTFIVFGLAIAAKLVLP